MHIYIFNSNTTMYLHVLNYLLLLYVIWFFTVMFHLNIFDPQPLTTNKDVLYDLSKQLTNYCTRDSLFPIATHKREFVFFLSWIFFLEGKWNTIVNKTISVIKIFCILDVVICVFQHLIHFWYLKKNEKYLRKKWMYILNLFLTWFSTLHIFLKKS